MIATARQKDCLNISGCVSTPGALGVLLFAVGLLSHATLYAQETVQPHPSREERFTPERLKLHMEVLGHDSLEGRGTGTRGERRAARYIADRLQLFGIAPAGDDGGYEQRILLHGSTTRNESALTIHTADSNFTLRVLDEYLLYSTGAQTFIPLPVPLFFVGYGIVAPEYDYNDYRNLNIADAIVVILAGEPYSEDSTYFEGSKRTLYSSPAIKQQIALARGARGSIIIPNPHQAQFNDWEYWKQQFSSENITLPIAPSENLSALLHPAAAEKLFRGSTLSLAGVLEAEAEGAIRSFPLVATLGFHGSFLERDFLASNIIGKLEGSDPLLRDSYLILAAHYDHLGIGPPVDGDSIYNGVFDNAAGVSAVLEMARAFALDPQSPRRSILFLFLTGEEKGRVGSEQYCRNPVVPLHKTVAAINVDGLAMFDTFRSVTGIGADYSSLGDLLSQTAADQGLLVEQPPWFFVQRDPFLSSDQFTFALAGIPAILVVEGFEYRNTPREEGIKRYAEWGWNVYHTPSDDLNQTIHYQAAVQHMRFLYEYALNVANTFRPPQWNPGSRFINARFQTIAEER